MANWKTSNEDPIYSFLIGRNLLDVNGKNVKVSLFYIPGKQRSFFDIEQRYQGKIFGGSSYFKKDSSNKYYGDWDGLFIYCLIELGINIYSWDNVDYYKKEFFTKDKLSKFRFCKYIKAKKQFEAYLRKIEWNKKFQNQFYEHRIKNIEKKRLKNI